MVKARTPRVEPVYKATPPSSPSVEPDDSDSEWTPYNREWTRDDRELIPDSGASDYSADFETLASGASHHDKYVIYISIVARVEILWCTYT